MTTLSTYVGFENGVAYQGLINTWSRSVDGVTALYDQNQKLIMQVESEIINIDLRLCLTIGYDNEPITASQFCREYAAQIANGFNVIDSGTEELTVYHKNIEDTPDYAYLELDFPHFYSLKTGSIDGVRLAVTGTEKQITALVRKLQKVQVDSVFS